MGWSRAACSPCGASFAVTRSTPAGTIQCPERSGQVGYRPEGPRLFGDAREENIRRITRSHPPLALAVLALAMLAAAGCVGFGNPEGWAGPAVTDSLLVASTDQGELSALDLNPESGPECDNSSDDDGDGLVNEGCPRVGSRAESGRECANDTNDDTVDNVPDDDKVNDGCTPWRWTFPTGQEDPELDLKAIYTTPLVSGDIVYFGAYSGEVFALNLEDGSEKWRFDTDDNIIAGLAARYSDESIDTLFVGTDDGILYALDADTGRPKGARFDAGDSIWAAPLFSDGVLYVASVNGKLFALDAETFDPVFDEPFEAGQGLISDPVLADGTIIVGGIDRELHAVDAASGEEREGWPFKADNWFWGRPLVVGGTVYAPSLDGRLYALSLADGSPVWNTPFKAEEGIRSTPVLTDDILLIVDRDGKVHGLDPLTGEPLPWSPRAIEKTVLSNPLILEDRVLISAEGGDLFRIDPAAGTFTEVVRP